MNSTLDYVERPSLESGLLLETPRSADFRRVVEIFGELGTSYSCDPDLLRTRDVYMNYVRGMEKKGYVARVEGKVAGVILFELSPLLSRHYLQIRHDGLAVDVAYRNRGIGVALLRKVLAFSGAAGATNVLIKASNPRVIKLYRSLPEIEERGIYFYYTPTTEKDTKDVVAGCE